MKRRAACLTIALAAAGWQPAAAGGLDGQEIADYRVWRSNRCYKPPPPPVRISDPLTYNLAVETFNRYFDQMKTYMECIGLEANEDYEAMQKVLERGLSRARTEAREDLERTRSAIEGYKDAYSGPDLNAQTPPGR